MKIAYEKFADKAFVKFFRMTPEVISVMGLSNLQEFSDLGGKLNDYSQEGLRLRQQALEEVYAQHRHYDFDRLTDAEKLSYQVFEFFLQYLPFEPWAGLAGGDFKYYAYPVCHHDGAPVETFNLLVNFHEVHSLEDADNYIKRLGALPKMFKDIEQGLRHRHKLKLSPPKSALKIIISEMTDLIEDGFQKSELLTTFEQKLSDADAIPKHKSRKYVEKASGLIERLYNTHLSSFLNCLETLLEGAGDSIGVSRFDRGAEYYQYCLTRQTTTHFTPCEIFDLGQTEVARLKTELARDVSELGYDGDDLKKSMVKATTAEGQGEDDSREEILAYYQKLVSETATKMRPYFNLYPKVPCLVKATPGHLETGRTTSYYPPSITGEYPGIFELNLKRERNKPNWSRNNLAYHEAYPGHHLQITLAQELAHLPLFRRSFVNAGYLEGWAKYAERLPYETGVDRDARYELQRKANELISASNLMLDVGIHTRNWSRQEAIDFSMEQAMIDRAMAEYLVDRISVTPAQTTAYMLGLITVRQMRDKACQLMGKQFTLAAFHDAILEEGALPLNMLVEHMDRVLVNDV